MTPPPLQPIAQQFAPDRTITAIAPFGSGNINDTFLVQLAPQSPTPKHGDRFVLQRINTQVFQHPEWVMANMCVVTEHIHQHLQHSPLDRRWETPRVCLTPTGQDHWSDAQGSFWRAISFIDNAEALQSLQDVDHAREVGFALGLFHQLISDLDPTQLFDTLEGFHITPRYLQQYEQVYERLLATRSQHKPPSESSPEAHYAQQFIADRAQWVSVLETAKANSKLPLRLMHGDPKVNNVLIDRTTQKAVSLIDLDTVKPGLIHYDIGDCLRSGCNPLGEEIEAWETVTFEPDLCRAILQGYGAIAKGFLTPNDYDYLFDAIRLITFELGLRFFTDYLAGNTYFKIKYPEHNLVRSLVQFQLTASIEEQEATLRTIIQDLQARG